MSANKRVQWLVSYPKSGNTWLRWLLSCYQVGAPVSINQLAPVVSPASRALVDHWLGIDSADLSLSELQPLRVEALRRYLSAQSQTVCLKVHEALTGPHSIQPLLPAGFDHRVVLMVRDPRDVAVSYAEFTTVNLDQVIQWLSDSAHRLPIYGRGLTYELPVHLGSWSDHLDSWAGVDEVLTLRYEDLHREPEVALARVLAHLGIPLDEERVSAAVGACHVDRAIAEESRLGFAEALPGAKFFRRGVAGDWKKHFNQEQAERLMDKHRPWMDRLGYLAH